jgi:hypothetical protein
MQSITDLDHKVIQLPVGGNTPSGQFLKEFLLWKISLEDEIPKVGSSALSEVSNKLTNQS